jgi:hypothetical protein
MSAGTERGAEQRPDTDRALDVSLPSVDSPASELPSWAPWALLGFAAIVVGGGTLLLGRGIGLAVALTAVGYGLAMWERPASSRVRARRRTVWSRSWSPWRSSLRWRLWPAFRVIRPV